MTDGHVPLVGDHHRLAGVVEVDLAELLDRRPGRDVEESRQLLVRDLGRRMASACAIGWSGVGEHPVERAGVVGSGRARRSRSSAGIRSIE